MKNFHSIITIKFSYYKIIEILAIFLLSVTVFLYFMPRIDDLHIIPYILLTLLFLILCSYFILHRNIDLFDPMSIFSLFCFTIIPTGLYFIASNFENGEYVTNYSDDVYSLFNTAILYFIIGYASALSGYFMVKRNVVISINFEPSIRISNQVLLYFTIFNFSVGLLNFLFNIYLIAAGNILDYMSTMSIRHAIYQEIPHTTLFYLNTYFSIYLFLLYLKLKNKSFKFIIPPVTVAIIMMFSTGRIFNTLSYIFSVIGICYYSNKNYMKYTKKYIIVFLFVLMSSVFIYIYRMLSNSYLNYIDSPTLLEYVAKVDPVLFFQKFFIEKGNTPNIPVLMKIIDSWESEIGFLYGQSLISWILNFLPSSIRPVGYQPSVMIMNTDWFPNALGAHPPTGIGEMYANFGILGPFIGMFLFGCFCAWIRNQLTRYNNFWILIIYCQVVTNFVFIYPKGEFDNLSLWQIIPVAFLYISLRFFTGLLRDNKFRRDPHRRYYEF